MANRRGRRCCFNAPKRSAGFRARQRGLWWSQLKLPTVRPVPSAQTSVKFFASQLATDANSPQGLPTYRILAEHGKPWCSRYDQQQNEIVINSAHRDFAASRTPMAKHRRYIGKLYAKEVVLINFPHESPGAAMERLIELTLRTEESL